MFKKSSSRANDSVPRRRRGDDAEQVPQEKVNKYQYRRNQTLSGYRGITEQEESPRHQAHQLALQRRRLGAIFLVVAIVVCALAFLLWQLIAQVHVTTSSKQLSSRFESSAYENAISEYLGINPAQRLRLALDEDALSAYVAAKLPEVEKLELSGTPGLSQSNFTVTFRTPVAGWQINANQYYVDVQGIVFEKNYYDTPTVQIVDESGVRPEQGSTIVGSRLLGFLGRVVAQAEGRGYTVTRAVLPQDATRELDLYFDSTSTRVKFSIDRGAGEQMEDADRSLKHLKSRNITAEYIDVRISGRAAYK